MNAQNSGFTPSRRTLVKGAAWSVPVVAVAGSAQAYAASPGCTDTGLCFGGIVLNKCCDAGSKYYWADITFENTSRLDTSVTFSFTLVTSANGDIPFSGSGDVPKESSRTFRVTSSLAGNCSQGTYDAFTIYFTDSEGNKGEAYVPGGSTDGSVCPDDTSGDSAKLDEAPQAEVTVEEPVVETQGESAPAEVETQGESAPAEVEAPEQSGTDAATATEAPSSNG